MPSDKIIGGNRITDDDPLQVAGTAVATIADGADVALGAKGDAAAGSGSVSVVALLKYLADLIKLEDVPHANGDKGVMMLGVRNDSGAVRSDADVDYTPLSVSSRGILLASGASSASGADGTSNTLSSLIDSAGAGRWLGSAINSFNGTTWDRQRNNLEGTALASAARTATVNSSDIVNYNGRGVIVFLDVTVASGTGGLTISIEEKDPVSGAYHQVQSGHGPYTTTGQRRAVYYPGASATLAAETVANLATVISRTFRIAISHNDGSSYTYSVGYAIIL